MLKKFLHNISAERTNINHKALLPTFYQHQKAYEFCKKYIRDKNILEVGCGTGVGSYNLSQFADTYTAIDIDGFTIEENKRNFKRSNLHYITSDLFSFPNTKKYEVLISLQVIEHFENVNEYLKKINLLLKKDGIFILTTPNSKTQSYNENPYHFKEYTAEELESHLKKHFKNVMIFGLHGDKVVKRYEKERKEKVLSVLNIDVFRIRRFIPRRVRQFLFDFSSTISRANIMSNSKSHIHITKENYYINKDPFDSIDLLAVAKK